ncbi:MAG TPA: hypothetical protein VFZ40_14825 [Pyrinomonadaceae bacterium]
MKYAKTLTLAFTLIFVLATAAFAGETSCPPTPPGETQGPPCAAQSMNDNSAGLRETLAPPPAPAVDVTDIAETLVLALLLF